MTTSIIQKKSFEFALEIIQLYRKLQEEQEYVISKQLLRSGTITLRIYIRTYI